MTDLMPLVGEIVEKRSPDEWAAVVRADLGLAVAGFVAAGQHLAKAKEELGWRRNEEG